MWSTRGKTPHVSTALPVIPDGHPVASHVGTAVSGSAALVSSNFQSVGSQPEVAVGAPPPKEV